MHTLRRPETVEFTSMVDVSDLKILVVDDQPEIVAELVDFCFANYLGAEVLQTIHPRQALAIIRAELPQIVLADWEMPGLTGLELTRLLTADETTREATSVILCTGKHITSADLRVALDAGAADYLRKPFDHPELTARINATLRDQRRRQELRAAQAALQEEKERNEALLRRNLALQKQNAENLALELWYNQRLSDELITQLDQWRDRNPDLDRFARELRSRLQNVERLRHLKTRLEDVREAFVLKLQHRYPQLTPGEVELCALYRAGMESREIAASKSVTMSAIKKARQRLRKKMGLTAAEDVVEVLKGI